MILNYIPELSAQVDPREGKIVNDGYPGGIIETWNLEKPRTIEGTYFINNDWCIGNVLLQDGRAINGIPLKYNLRDELLILLDEKRISRIINEYQIKEFTWFDNDRQKNNRFVNCMEYNKDGVAITGFMEVLTLDDVGLLLYRHLTLEKGNYSLIHDAGQKNDEYRINEVYYLTSNKDLIEIKNKKAFYEYTGKDADKAGDYIKRNRLQFKDLDDLIRIVNYYNSILE